MSDEKTHWKKLVNPNYMGAYSMPSDGSDVILTIDRVVNEPIKGEKGREDHVLVCYFKEKTFSWSNEPSKPMILNRTNSKTITNIYKTPYIEDWIGKKIQVFTDVVDMKGDKVDGLRIRLKVPTTEKPTLQVNTAAFKQALDYIKKGGKIEKIEEKYILTEEIKTKLNENSTAAQ